MKIRNLSITLLLSAAIASPGAAQDLTGTWEISTQGGRGGPQTSTLVLAQDGEALTGTMTFSLGGPGGRGGGSQELEVSNGTVDGNSFSFTVTLSFQGNSFDLNYSGTVDGDEMSGTRGGPRGGVRLPGRSLLREVAEAHRPARSCSRRMVRPSPGP